MSSLDTLLILTLLYIYIFCFLHAEIFFIIYLKMCSASSFFFFPFPFFILPFFFQSQKKKKQKKKKELLPSPFTIPLTSSYHHLSIHLVPPMTPHPSLDDDKIYILLDSLPYPILLVKLFPFLYVLLREQQHLMP